MSLDFYLHCEGCGSELYSGNVTHNVSPMWTLCGAHDGLYNSAGKLASQVVDALAAGIRAMEAAPDAYRALNPKNGWGNYEIALEFLREVARACKRWPRAVVGVSK